MKQIVSSLLILSLFISISLNANSVKDSPHAKKTFEIYEKIISIPTVQGNGKVPEMVDFLVSELKQAGFTDKDINILPYAKTASLVVRYRGDGSSGNKPILFLGHMDVVEAFAKDWERPPFKLTWDDVNFYGRGTIDNKLGIAMLTSTFIRLKKAGFVPNRDLIIAFSGDEETDMITTRMLAAQPNPLTNAEYALNSDAGGGDLSPDGKPIAYLVQAAEKTYATFELTVRNPGGHSSRPRPDNAIYELMDALKNIQAYQFPVMSSMMTQNFFRITGEQLGGDLGKAMVRFANNPMDKAASDRIAVESSYVGTTRTTCVTTMLSAGHAENALPQSATATVNCRIFPGVSVAQVQNTLQKVVQNKAVEFLLNDEPTVSPISELRDDVMEAINKAVDVRYPGINIIGYMESGGTDGMHFRKNGIPTWAVSSVFMNPDEMYAHGLNERLPIAAFYAGLDHWSIIIKDLAGK
ncbi:MAG: M20/M25/M40 family metallo-hydrolase [Gammaproteobacteria bacterium]|nr:M20/M25/M40 family metallo-hydrolase [Gammaproteobacteria bacterium]